MAKDTRTLLAGFATGFVVLAGLMLGVYVMLDAKIEALQEGQIQIRERLAAVEARIAEAAPVAMDDGLAIVVQEPGPPTVVSTDATP